MRDAAKWIDKMIRTNKSDPRGEPDCYLIVKKGATREPVVAVFSTEQSLREKFPSVAAKFGDVTIASWWFDDNEKF
jgi:hypothetical protein